MARFELDGRDMKDSEFLVAKAGEQLLGFGRIRVHSGCDEFCTLGIIESHRSTGIGKMIISAIIKASTQPLYLACIIPSYFEPYGFKIVHDVPFQMKAKLDYCNEALPTGDEYVVMKYGN